MIKQGCHDGFNVRFDAGMVRIRTKFDTRSRVFVGVAGKISNRAASK